MSYGRLPRVTRHLLFVQFILTDIGSKRQIQTLEQIIKLRKRFLTEVAELQEVGLVELYQVAEGLDVGCLQAVEGADREIHVGELGLEQLTHVEHFLVELLVAVLIGILKGDLLVGEQSGV